MRVVVPLRACLSYFPKGWNLQEAFEAASPGDQYPWEPQTNMSAIEAQRMVRQEMGIVWAQEQHEQARIQLPYKHWAAVGSRECQADCSCGACLHNTGIRSRSQQTMGCQTNCKHLQACLKCVANARLVCPSMSPAA